MVTTKFMAIPKDYRFVEELEEGIFFAHHDISWKSESPGRYDVIWIDKAMMNDCHSMTYTTNDYWIFINGRLVNNE